MTPGEFTQLTGRAGRRGIDTIGHAVVVDHHGFIPATAAALSSKRVYPLHSSFKPTFNMAVNLLNSSDYETARITLDHSFAQWEANESAWQLEAQMDTLRKALGGYERAFDCEFGDFKEFMRLRMRLSDLEKNEDANSSTRCSARRRREAKRSKTLTGVSRSFAKKTGTIPAANAPIFRSISNGGIGGRVKCVNWNVCSTATIHAPAP